MKILAIETSCDETGISIIDAKGSLSSGVSFTVLADELASQAQMHSEYGGVYPSLAKREHIKALPILLEQALKNANVQSDALDIKPDAIAVTHGPGLEPALWTGITFAQELAKKWSVPLIPVNHMEGHIYSAIMQNINNTKNYKLRDINYPAIALLISGGHTMLELIKTPFDYEYLGGTVDDAVGEAFDKVARMLGLGYPGGPIISKLAQEARTSDETYTNESAALIKLLAKPLPRPMLHSHDLNFSFSGLKTAVLYKIKEIKKILDTDELPASVQRQLAREFEDACADVLSAKTLDAIESHEANTLIIGGGVSANSYINKSITDKLSDSISHNTEILTPAKGLTGDNALMIAIAGYLRAQRGEYAKDINGIQAHGTLQLAVKANS